MFNRQLFWLAILVLSFDGLRETHAVPFDGDSQRLFGIELLSLSQQSRLISIDGTDDSDNETVFPVFREGHSSRSGNDPILLVDNESQSPDRVGLSDIFPLFTGDSSLAGIKPVSDDLRPTGIEYFVAYDAFRGISDGSWENNGIRIGFNFATRIGPISDRTGIGFQVGSSLGLYDWAGTDYRLKNDSVAQSQGFLTYGFFRKPDESTRLLGALVQDWMFNSTYGVFGENPTLSQLRGQVGYAVSASNEFGVWGTAHVLSSVINVPSFGPTKWQSVNQLSGYWHHKWSAGGPDTWISIGVPSYDRLSGGGSLGDYLVSATANCPLSDAVSIYSSVTYMHQSGGAGGDNAYDEAWNFSVGINIYPRRNSRTTTVAGQRWMPLLPVANNGSFLVDTSQGY